MFHAPALFGGAGNYFFHKEVREEESRGGLGWRVTSRAQVLSGNLDGNDVLISPGLVSIVAEVL